MWAVHLIQVVGKRFNVTGTFEQMPDRSESLDHIAIKGRKGLGGRNSKEQRRGCAWFYNHVQITARKPTQPRKGVWW